MSIKGFDELCFGNAFGLKNTILLERMKKFIFFVVKGIFFYLTLNLQRFEKICRLHKL